MIDSFRLLMISAMYENGGNTTHRLLDGHPELFVYPFESQLGTRLVTDLFTSVFPQKYRWPTFALHATPAEDYAAIIDEEGKVRTRTPNVSKFRHWDFELSDDERRDRYVELVSDSGRSRGGNVAAFFRATFDTWRDRTRSGQEQVYVGYSPVIVVDALKILDDLPAAHVLHIVRNPWSAYADTKKRPVPLSLADYLTAWTLNQQFALLARQLRPGRVHVVRFEDIVGDRMGALGTVCEAVGVGTSETLATPSWNGTPLDQVYPWGTIREATADANRATAAELSPEEQEEIRVRAGQYLSMLGYENYLADGSVQPPQVPV